MGKGQELAERFEKINNQFISTVEGYPDDKWQNTAEADGRQVNVVAHHVASSHSAIAGLVKAVASGGEVPQFTLDMINEGNAVHAAESTGVSKEETLELLRSGGQEAAQMLRGLTDDDLAKTASMPAFGDQPASAQMLAENILIHHPEGHLESIKGS